MVGDRRLEILQAVYTKWVSRCSNRKMIRNRSFDDNGLSSRFGCGGSPIFAEVLDENY
jgi:hypothetical protein